MRNKEIQKEIAVSDLKLNYEREKEVDKILIKATISNTVEKTQLYNQVIILIRDFPEIKKQRTMEVARKICYGKLEEINNEQIS